MGEAQKIDNGWEWDCLVAERDALQARVAELEEQYGELIFAVATKYPDETRHQTALRYIQQAENREASPACEPCVCAPLSMLQKRRDQEEATLYDNMLSLDGPL